MRITLAILLETLRAFLVRAGNGGRQECRLLKRSQKGRRPDKWIAQGERGTSGALGKIPRAPASAERKPIGVRVPESSKRRLE